MQLIDAHAHFYNSSDYLHHLLQMMDTCGISKCCLSGLGKIFNCKSNKDVKNAFECYPDKIIGSYFIRPGKVSPAEIEEAHSQGFKMLKVSIPTKSYDNKSFFPLWKKAEELEMPVLFHTGIVTIAQNARNENVSSWNMHPMRLEPIANAFPNLNLIIAHLGVHWNEDAAELMRMRPNVYSDITGEPDGWRVRAERIGIKKWLWWEGAFKKLIFGTDVFYNKIPLILEQDKNRLQKYKIDHETKSLFFSKNIIKLLGMD
ncbi:MAG: hypothetical protein BAJALOKI1v1_350019 [Promethearchaeota archaeon]|nr:MAG: hypothetical protein BAJALOKI1v1_350019 [Candidatus Lokiarchaeota archaeon]